ncbi:MAG: HigA family addiction module antidote protein [Spirochaetaceae bacterium]|jgi:addiction module HigA family antidote|nr:HigA family addiction module antidote protein [Spirochaetaceae bacterium]
MAKSSTGKISGKTPGAVLEKYIQDFNLSVSGLALELGQNATTFKKILDDSKRITVEIALLLAKKFGTTADFWIDLQKKAALAEAKADTKLQNRIKGLKKAVKDPTGVKKPGRKPGRKPAVAAAAPVTVAKKPGRKPGRKPGKKPASKTSSVFSSSGGNTDS